MDEVNVQSTDLGHELRQGVQPVFDLAPVVFRLPVMGEFLHRRELHALRFIRDRFPVRPLRCAYAPAKIDKLHFRDVHSERANAGIAAIRHLLNVSHSLDLLQNREA